jgi:hypothetical protein
MSRFLSKRGLIVAIIVLAVTLVAVGAIVLAKKPSQPSTVTTPDTSKQTTPSKDTTTETDATESNSSTTPASSVDPQTLTSVDITPLSVTVFYSKGTPGFEFTVLKTANKTQYVQFTSSDLVGTKCTNDQGAFASIIKNPSADEMQTTSQTVKVGSDTYGLSLASTGCTGNTDLLTEYQTGFKNGFSNLKAL